MVNQCQKEREARRKDHDVLDIWSLCGFFSPYFLSIYQTALRCLRFANAFSLYYFVYTNTVTFMSHKPAALNHIHIRYSNAEKTSLSEKRDCSHHNCLMLETFYREYSMKINTQKYCLIPLEFNAI